MIDALFSLLLQAAAADKDIAAIEDVSLDELLSGETTVSSTRTTRLRDAPGIVTVVTREDMLRIGARDVGELLPLIPGFDLHVDVFGVVGGLFRGLYASDGRILVLVDDVEVNDIAYGSSYMFNHIPIDDVERVEILRGPGSARFGGFASLTVIHIITRGQSRRDDVGVAADYGQAAADAPFLNQGAGVMGGHHVDVAGGLDLSFSAHAGTRQQSLRDVTDLSGKTGSMRGASEARSLFVNASARLPWLRARLIVDGYSQQGITAYDTVQTTPGRTLFPALFLDVQAPLALTPALTLTPRLFVTRQLPWRPEHGASDFPVQGDPREIDDRVRLGTQARWQALPSLTLSAGVEGTLDTSSRPTTGDRDGDWTTVGFDFAPDDDENDRYQNGATYGEAVVDADLFVLTVGARGEVHSAYGASFVPRVALTRVFDGAHVKLLVAGAFRAPAIDNIRFEVGEIKPERTRVIEMEGGLALSSATYLTVNAFDIAITDPLIYFVNEDVGDFTSLDGYTNFPRTGTRGVEASLLGTAPFGRLEVNYSFATAAGQNAVPIYAIPADDGRLLAAPQHKAAFIGSLFLTPGVTTTMTAVLRSERATQVGFDDDGAAVFGELPPSLMLNAALRLNNVLVPGVDGTIGIKNALGEDFRLAQPYASGHPPLPIDDRELYVRLAGHFDL